MPYAPRPLLALSRARCPGAARCDLAYHERMDDTRYDIPADDTDLLAECDVWVFRATGPGGQGVNTTDSAVRLRHRPSGITVVCRRERSQLQNKRACLERLREKLDEHNAALDAPKRVPTRKSRAAKARQVEAKRYRARVKRARGRVDRGEE